MMLTTQPFHQTQPLKRRRAAALVLGISVLALQLFLPSLDSHSFTGILPLLPLPVIAFCLHQLASNTWVWNRLFRRETDLDEYEVHARNAFIARAYSLAHGWLGWISFLAYIVGGGFLNPRFQSLNLFPKASPETANAVFFIVVLLAFSYLPRLVAAVTEDVSDD